MSAYLSLLSLIIIVAVLIIKNPFVVGMAEVKVR